MFSLSHFFYDPHTTRWSKSMTGWYTCNVVVDASFNDALKKYAPLYA